VIPAQNDAHAGYMTRSRWNQFIVDAAKHREDPNSFLYLLGYDPETHFPIYRTSAGTIVPPPSQPLHSAFLPATDLDGALVKVTVITALEEMTQSILNAYLTTPRLPQSPASQILSTAAQTTDNIGSNSRETRPLPRRNSSGASTRSRADTITLAEFLAQTDRHPRPGVPHSEQA
jgi:hypothetical protein